MGTNDRVPPDLPSGTVDLLILKSLAGGKRHGYGIAQHIRTSSGEALELGESSL
jgi:DNA-binding PadR family transcriptional regulator